MRHEHAPTAVTTAAELGHGFAVVDARVEHFEIPLVEVADDFAAGETAHGDDHCGGRVV